MPSKMKKKKSSVAKVELPLLEFLVVMRCEGVSVGGVRGSFKVMTDRVKQNHEYDILSSAEIAHSTQWQCNNFATHAFNVSDY